MVKQKEAHIGRRIAEARRLNGMTQRQLASATGHAERTVMAWEGGTRHPRPRALREIATAVRRDVAWFYVDPNERSAA